MNLAVTARLAIAIVSHPRLLAGHGLGLGPLLTAPTGYSNTSTELIVRAVLVIALVAMIPIIGMWWGDSTDETPGPPGGMTVEGGDVGQTFAPPTTQEKVRVRIVNPGDLTIWVAEKPVTFEAVTIPPGMEQFIVWETPGEQGQMTRHGYGPTFTETWQGTVVAQVTASLGAVEGAKSEVEKLGPPEMQRAPSDDLIVYIYAKPSTGNADSFGTVLGSDGPNIEIKPSDYEWSRDHALPFTPNPIDLSEIPILGQALKARDVLDIFKDVSTKSLTSALRESTKDGNINGSATLEYDGDFPLFLKRATFQGNIAGVLSTAVKDAGKQAASDLLGQLNTKLFAPLQQQAIQQFGPGATQVLDIQAIQQDFAKMFQQLGDYLGDVLKDAVDDLLSKRVCGTPVSNWLDLTLAIGDKSDEAIEKLTQSGAKGFHVETVKEGAGTSGTPGTGGGGGGGEGTTAKTGGPGKAGGEGQGGQPQGSSITSEIEGKLKTLQKELLQAGLKVDFKLLAPKVVVQINVDKLAEFKNPSDFIKKLSYEPKFKVEFVDTENKNIRGIFQAGPSLSEDPAKGAPKWKDLGSSRSLEKGASAGLQGSATFTTDQSKKAMFFFQAGGDIEHNLGAHTTKGTFNFSFGLEY